MVLPDAIVVAVGRWLRLLSSSSFAQASEIIRVSAAFSDLTLTQYASALEWAKHSQLVVSGPDGLQLASDLHKIPAGQLHQKIFRTLLEQSFPLWLADADSLVRTPAELPQDALALAMQLGVNEMDAFAAVKQLHGKIDLEQRARVGAAGERELVSFLEERWPGSTEHIALTDDGFGYDVVFRHDSSEWHLEVKSTLRRGRLVVHLSRQEYEMGKIDPAWRLVVVGLDNELRLRALATARHKDVIVRAPVDMCHEVRWSAASHQLTSQDLEPGIPFVLDQRATRGEVSATSLGAADDSVAVHDFSWMPQPRPTG